MASRNGSRGKGKVDSASSLEHSADAPPAPAQVAAQLGKLALSE